MEFNLKKILKALLLSNSEPLSIRDIQAVITRYHEQAEAEPPEPEAEEPSGEGDGQGVIEPILQQVPSLLTATQIRDAMDAIAHELEDQREVYRLLQGPAGYRIATSPEYADWVRLMRNEAKPMKLSQAAMETLSIIAYRQPVTRAEMEAIRGVSVDSAVSKLLELELILVTGRADLPGRPIQYGTTDKFLEFIGVRSIEELPASDVLSPTQITEWFRRSTQEDEPLTDKDVGLPEEDKEAPSEDKPEENA
ncbi:MAG: SMC-Scp complex subunit ScpB [Puniceicoccales bacterium]